MTDFIFFLPRHIIPPRAERAAFLRLSVLCALFILPVILPVVAHDHMRQPVFIAAYAISDHRLITPPHPRPPAATHSRRGGHWPSAAASNDHISTGANPHPVWHREFASARSYLPADTADEQCSPLRMKTPRSGRCTSFASQRPLAAHSTAPAATHSRRGGHWPSAAGEFASARSYLPADTADERCSPLRKKTPCSGRCTSFASQRPVTQRPYPAQSVNPPRSPCRKTQKGPGTKSGSRAFLRLLGFVTLPAS